VNLRQLWAFVWAFTALSAQASPNATQPHVSVELISQTSTLQPGQPVTLGFHFKIDHGWHLYWSNPGDSGLAPEFIWTLPDGFSTQPILWPTPQRLTAPSLMDYGYKSDVLFMVPVQVPADAHPGQIITFSVLARWLVCNEICIPGRVNLQLKMVVKPKKPGPSKRAKLFTAALKSLPLDWPEHWKAQGTLDTKAFRLSITTREKPQDAWFFPLNPNQIDNVAPQNFHLSASTFHLTLKRSDQLTANVKTLDGLIVLKTKSGAKGYSVSIPLAAQ
jgi:DsbC/DsbD-like thiol-disulfide interchange protein